MVISKVFQTNTLSKLNELDINSSTLKSFGIDNLRKQVQVIFNDSKQTNFPCQVNMILIQVYLNPLVFIT